MAPAVSQAAYSASCCTAPYSGYIALIPGMRRRLMHAVNTRFWAVDLASSTHSRVVLDIGCGLGEIISRVRAEKRWGVDISAAAIAAARRLSGRRVSFAIGSGFAPDEIAKVVSDRPIDLVIMTGWTHMELEKLVATIRSIQQYLSVRMLLIDTVRPGVLEDCFAHSVEDLTRLGEVRASVDCGDGARDLHLIALTPWTH